VVAVEKVLPPPPLTTGGGGHYVLTPPLPLPLVSNQFFA